MNATDKVVLWWGRFDPDYSRNRILRKCYADLGWRVADFHPLLSAIGDVEARLRQPPRADLIHVPCFRQRDLVAASRYARRLGIPLLFDPLISAYDKQVFEREKFGPQTHKAKRLLNWERRLFARANIVLADTREHARFFAETLAVPTDRLQVVYVGAEEVLFFPETEPHAPNDPLEVLFYGSFIPLQGPEVIVEAARLYQGPPVRWVLLGNGSLRTKCENRAKELSNVFFENWVPYHELPDRIRHADILLGVFGSTPKTMRVIPNKVFQALACGKPLVTCVAPTYPDELLRHETSGVFWVQAGDAAALARVVADLAASAQTLNIAGARARASFEQYFNTDRVRAQLAGTLSELVP